MKKLGFGLMRLPKLEPDDDSSIDIEAFKRMADTFISRGFTYFDTAAPYHKGSSELAFREAVVGRYPRSAYTITDKLSLFMLQKAEEMPAFFEGQLERLGVEYLDYYLLHALGETSYRKAQSFGAFEFVQQLKADGRVRHIGFSFHDKAALLDEILTAHPEMEYVQLQLNYLDWEDTSVEARKCYEVAVRHQKSVIVMEPVKGGSLVHIPEAAKELYRAYAPQASVASWAIRYAATPANVVMVLSGMSDEAQMEDNLSYMEDFRPLNAEESQLVEQAADIIRSSITVPCTACRYCVEGCPKNIAIPEYFSVYNNLKKFGEKQSIVASTYYDNLTATHGRASDCIQCGNCETRCPQRLPIRKHLADIAGTFERS